jgi:SnoaL-like domain
VSAQNVELHRRGIEAFNTRNVEGLIAQSDPEIEWHSGVAAAIGSGVYQGHDGLRGWYREFQEVWGDDIQMEPEAFFDLGEYTIAFYVLRGRGKLSGAEVAMPNAQICKWRNKRCVYIKGYVKREHALEDLGVSEDHLEPIAP